MKRTLGIGCAVLVASVLASGGAPKVVPDATYHLAVLSEPSALICENGQTDCTTKLPKSKRALLCSEPFYVEVWVTKSSPDLDPDLPGLDAAVLGHAKARQVVLSAGKALEPVEHDIINMPCHALALLPPTVVRRPLPAPPACGSRSEPGDSGKPH